MGVTGKDLAILFVLVVLASAANGKVGPEDGRLRVFIFGESWRMHAAMRNDPKITISYVPSGDLTYPELMARFMRIYMPRTYEDLVADHDVIVLSDLVPWGFEGKHFYWFRDSIADRGMGMVLNEMGWYGISDWTGNAAWDWVKTVLYEAYPCELVIGAPSREGRIEILKPEHPFMRLPGLESMAYASLGIQLPREGTTVWAVYRISGEPVLLSRPYGRGMAISNAPGMERALVNFIEWEYHPEFFSYHAYFAGGVDIPEDLALVHRVRTQLRTFTDHSSLVEAMIDFIDRFNANTRPVEEALARVKPLRREAEDLYVQERYEESAQVLSEANVLFDEVNDLAISLKDQALFWVYVIEWFSVSAASMMTGVILWALMIRRRLYREVGTTRHGRRRGG